MKIGDYVILKTAGGRLVTQEVLRTTTIKDQEYVVLPGCYLDKNNVVLTNAVLNLPWPGVEFQYCIQKEVIEQLKKIAVNEYLAEEVVRHRV